MYQEKFLRRAIELSAEAMNCEGTEPFGAVVVRDGAIVGEGVNRSLANFDPTSHGETEAIRDACRNLGTVDLSGCELYTSCEPCALCVAAMEIARISHLYYAADLDLANDCLHDLPDSARFGIDPAHLRAECGTPVERRSMPSHQALREDAAEVLTAWVQKLKGPAPGG